MELEPDARFLMSAATIETKQFRITLTRQRLVFHLVGPRPQRCFLLAFACPAIAAAIAFAYFDRRGKSQGTSSAVSSALRMTFVSHLFLLVVLAVSTPAWHARDLSVPILRL